MQLTLAVSNSLLQQTMGIGWLYLSYEDAHIEFNGNFWHEDLVYASLT